MNTFLFLLTSPRLSTIYFLLKGANPMTSPPLYSIYYFSLTKGSSGYNLLIQVSSIFFLPASVGSNNITSAGMESNSQTPSKTLSKRSRSSYRRESILLISISLLLSRVDTASIISLVSSLLIAFYRLSLGNGFIAN